MTNSTQKKIKFIIDILYIVVLLVIICFAAKYLYILFPFIIGLIFALIINPVVRFLKSKCHISAKITSPVLVLALTALVIFLVAQLGTWIYAQASHFMSSIPGVIVAIKNSIITFTEWLSAKFTFLSPTFADKIIKYLDSITKNPTLLFTSSSVDFAVGTVKNVAFSLPSIFIFFIATVLSSILICGDLPKVKSFIYKQISHKGRIILFEMKEFLTKTIGRMLRAYLILMFITFCELSVGFLIIGVKSAFLLAAIIAVIDVLPIFGCGTVLIPWAVIALINGSVVRGVSILLIYLIITVVRQLTEPRIVGAQIGLNPLVTLIAIYVGYKLLGVGGMFLFPIIAITIVQLQKTGHIHWWNSLEEETEQ